MDAAGYVALGRQSGLMREMQVIANNIANASTTGYRREGLIFSEHVSKLAGAPSLSMAQAAVRSIDLTQSDLEQTGGSFDIAIQGDGFFLVQTPDGQRLTRAGQFTPSADGELLNHDGHALLDAGGAPIFIQPDSTITIGRDGTISANDQPIGQVGVWQPTDPLTLKHHAGTNFTAADVEPVAESQIMQGFLETSNVNPMREIARMIEVQRAYELGQKFLEAEDNRGRTVIQTLGS